MLMVRVDKMPAFSSMPLPVFSVCVVSVDAITAGVAVACEPIVTTATMVGCTVSAVGVNSTTEVTAVLSSVRTVEVGEDESWSIGGLVGIAVGWGGGGSVGIGVCWSVSWSVGGLVGIVVG